MYLCPLAANPLLDAYHHSDLFGRLIFLSLFFLSFLCWVILVYKFLMTKTVQRTSSEFYDYFSKGRNRPLSLDVKAEENSRFSQPFLELYMLLRHYSLEVLKKNKSVTEKQYNYLSSADIDLLGSHLASSISSNKKQMEKNLFLLSTTASLAPFLGLLGTVWGILITFSQLQSTASGNSNEVVLGGISMALGTTVLGLLVAIPALIAYNYLKNKINDLTIDMEEFANEMLGAVEIHYRKVEV